MYHGAVSIGTRRTVLAALAVAVGPACAGLAGIDAVTYGGGAAAAEGGAGGDAAVSDGPNEAAEGDAAADGDLAPLTLWVGRRTDDAPGTRVKVTGCRQENDRCTVSYTFADKPSREVLRAFGHAD